MIPAPAIDDLAREIHLRRVPHGPFAGRGPFILFIGEGCARAAGAPSREDIARTATFLCSEHARNISGQCIPVNAGEPV